MASIFWLDDELGSEIYLDGIVTVIDAKNCLKQLDEVVDDNTVNAAVKQVALGDVILLNKVDLVPDERDVDKVTDRLRSINSMAKLEHTKMSKIDLGMILDLHSYDGDDVIPTQFSQDQMNGQ